MKLLFDENLSPKLPDLCSALFPGSAHVRDCGLKGHPDEEVWQYAKANGFAIVSKDSDFHECSLLYGPPPKFIWLRLGNCTRDDLLRLLTTRVPDIQTFEANPGESVLVLG
jgi:predicted nuclease of predicted toxin-antitoxin system